MIEQIACVYAYASLGTTTHSTSHDHIVCGNDANWRSLLCAYIKPLK